MATSHFSEKRWKYVSIGLMAVLAVGFSFPQAFAAPIDTALSIVKDIQAKVTNTTFGLQAIKNAVDTKASQATVDTLSSKLEMVRTVTLNDMQVPDTEQIVLLPITPGQAYVIHGVLTASSEESSFSVTCQTSGPFSGSGSFRIIELATNTEESFDTACIEFSLGRSSAPTPAASVDGTILYTIQYRHE
jgi:hypothetical protein